MISTIGRDHLDKVNEAGFLVINRVSNKYQEKNKVFLNIADIGYITEDKTTGFVKLNLLSKYSILVEDSVLYILNQLTTARNSNNEMDGDRL
jgi:hypothetical protein